ncbi:hypothetical protein MBLNU457_g1089t2 [Dothideomycetes sp. NU457]
MDGVDVISTDVLLWSLFLWIIKDPRREFRMLVKRKPGSRHVAGTTSSSEKKKSLPADSLPKQDHLDYDVVPWPQDIMQRIPWVTSLLISMRLVDWKINEPSHDKRQPTHTTGRGHFEFIRDALLRQIIGYLALDLTSSFIRSDAYFHDFSISILSPLPPYQHGPALLVSLYNISPPLLLRTIVIATQAYCMISSQYHLPMIPLVFLHYLNLWPDDWSPHLWPTYFGPVTSILDHGLAGFWGTYWHQVVRWLVSGSAPAIADMLGYKRPPPSAQSNHLNGHTNGSTDNHHDASSPKDTSTKSTDAEAETKANRTKTIRFTILTLTAFFNSGLVHLGLVPPHPLWSAYTANQLRLLVGGFFWIQPLGILLEIALSHFLASLLPKTWRESDLGKMLKRMANLVWIAVWSCVCFPLLGEAARQLRWCAYHTVPVSALAWMRGEEWVMWPCLK